MKHSSLSLHRQAHVGVVVQAELFDQGAVLVPRLHRERALRRRRRHDIEFESLVDSPAATQRTGMGEWMTVRHSFLGLIAPSQYVKRPTVQEQSLFTGERSRYLVVYPFTKSTDWYLLGADERQKVMNEHMKVGHRYHQVRQLLAYSFGLDDMDFLVAYETDDLPAFGELVRELRGTESRRTTVRDTPILVGVHRPIDEITALLGAE